MGGNEVSRFWIVGAQKFERPLGKHHSETPGRVGGILLVQLDVRSRVALFPKVGEIKTGRTSA